jgi:hypothetical protein
MPLWEIFHTASAFAEPHAKAWLAGNLTAFYVAAGLPAFYVSVLFNLLPGEDMWIGGKPAAAVDGAPEPLQRPYVRFSVAHIAIHRGGNATDEINMCDRIDEVCGAVRPTYWWDKADMSFPPQVLKPHLEGYDWEYHIVEPNANEWRINGLIPPPHGSDAEKAWTEAGKPIPWR